ncbi:MAG: hypothetical protein MUF04_15210, partial [Akkermansiaceae bacterium]|nr:hypothetical protein [Akkermansiaceae bacterium]
FRVTPAGALTTLANFAAASSRPYATLIHGGDGNFYGTTRGDALGNIAGTVFRMTPGGEVTTLVAFTDTVEPHKGAMPGASLVRGSDGYLYGSTSLGGATGWGTVFRMTPGGEMTTLVEFDGIGNPNKGITPSSALLQGTDGNFYGTTYEGGSYNFGTIYQMTPAGKLTTLVSFSLNERVNKGAHPYSGLIEGSDGCFYGTTLAGGSYVQGTVFKTTPAGDLTTLVEFAGGANGSGPAAGLVLAGDGNFYGATNIGGNSGFGTLYRVTPAGELTTLLSFTGTGGAHMGRNINAAMVVGPDGALYGTTYLGGSLDQGTIFRYTLAGSFTTLVEFGGQTGPIKGSKPAGSLMAAADGNFYGTTNEGGFLNVGTVFKMTPGGVLTTLHEFGFTDGWAPSDRLIQGPDGNIYGTTTGNTVFKLTPAGVLSNIFTLSFDPVDCFLTSGVTFGRDGNLYGVTVGDSNAGGAGHDHRVRNRWCDISPHACGDSGNRHRFPVHAGRQHIGGADARHHLSLPVPRGELSRGHGESRDIISHAQRRHGHAHPGHRSAPIQRPLQRHRQCPAFRHHGAVRVWHRRQ